MDTCKSGKDVANLLRHMASELNLKTQRGSWNSGAYRFERELIKGLRAQLEATACVVESGLVDTPSVSDHEIRKWRAENPELVDAVFR